MPWILPQVFFTQDTPWRGLAIALLLGCGLFWVCPQVLVALGIGWVNRRPRSA
ncbi:hypothetical protein [Simplicispira psychrophila]|uniref:hypothetical protein n=1 Tax=Simplicispira psychrophila TaxID=80882 RepID=UPI0012EC957A|nr:hypothetical protein [Simplicispira psychrophila]